MMGFRLNKQSLLPVVLMIALAGCGESKQVKLTATEAKQLASDTMAYFTARRAQFSEVAVMNDDALSATFLFSKELRAISARWPAILDGDAEADKYGYCRHLMITAQSYAEAMNHFAFKGGTEKLAKDRRKDFKQDWSGCEAKLAGSPLSKPD